MLEEIFRFLSDYEPTISAIVGIVTLSAAIWGAFQLTVLARRKKFDINARSLSLSAGQNSPLGPKSRPTLWSVLLNLGLGSRSRLEELVSVRSVNVALILVLGMSFSWLVISLFSRSTLLLTALSLVAFVAALIAFSFQLSGRTGAARWIMLAVANLWWLSVTLAVGPQRGMEYLLAALLALPILVFSRAQLGQMYLSIFLTCLLFLAVIGLQQVMPPFLALSAKAIFLGYFLNVALMAFAVYAAVRYYKDFAATNYHLLDEQKRQSDNLAHTLLPKHIASRVANHEETVAEWHPNTAVLYASVEGLDGLYKKMSAIQLVHLLSEIFLHLDKLAVHHGVDKVTTLGTNYVVTTGIDRQQEPDYAAIAACALAMCQAVSEISTRTSSPLTLRAGIATGQAVSGVIGEARPCFDIWGEAVEQANRLRTVAVANTVRIDESTFWRLKGHFDLVACDDEGSTYDLREAVDG